MAPETSTLQAIDVAETSEQEINRLFELQKANQYRVGNSTVAERKAKLNRLHKVLLENRTAIQKALYDDFGKHPSEVDLSEIYAVTNELKHAKKSLKKWMGTNRRRTPLALMGASSRIKYEPKGVVLIISPWNFPVNLTFGPLVSAISAGNCVMIKPSEMTPHTSALMKKIISEIFNESEVVVVEGKVKTAQQLLSLPFNHIFFTGSPATGKIVMEAAAKNLCSVTLELGGKSPTIVDETADIHLAAKRIVWAKYLNNGQVCIAPDHVYIHESKKKAFIDAIKKTIEKYYSKDASTEASYNRIVNERHYGRLKGSIMEASTNGAEMIIGGEFKDEENYISPTVMTGISKDSKLMQEEIFGPILPLISFNSLDEVIQEINFREKPLALYIYSKSTKNINHLLSNTRAGGSCINHNAIQFFNLNLGFGGSNNSGIGRGHGDEGFKAFSNPRGIIHQHIPNALDLLTPPYNDFKQKLIDLTIKWF
jgi:aldehyde dehydrogenase (NAD+)